MPSDQFTRLLYFLNRLDAANFSHRLTMLRPESVCVDVAVPGQRWEIEFMEDGTVEVERSNYIVTSTPFADWYIPPDARLRAYVTANFRLLRSGGLLFYVRNGFQSGNREG